MSAIDKPRNLGRGMTQGGHIAAPIAKDFMKLALADKPPIPFKVPAGIKLVRVDSKSGMRPAPASGRTFWKPSSRAPRRRIITRSSAWPMRTAGCRKDTSRDTRKDTSPTPAAISCVREPADFIDPHEVFTISRRIF